MADESKAGAPGDIRDSRASAPNDRPTPAEELAETRRLRKIAFLAAFAGCGRITKAAKAAGIDPDTHYEWKKTDPDYAKSFDDLRERVTDLLEDEAIRRAMEGVDEPQIGRVARDTDGLLTNPDGSALTVKRFSDTLLVILLKGNRPERYRERYELTGKDGGAIEITDAEAARELAALFETARARAAGEAAAGEAQVGTPAGPTDGGGAESSV